MTHYNNIIYIIYYIIAKIIYNKAAYITTTINIATMIYKESMKIGIDVL